MSIIKVPPEVGVSPQDGWPLRFDTDAAKFSDDQGNHVSTLELAKCRKLQVIMRWIRENYPLKKGDKHNDDA